MSKESKPRDRWDQVFTASRARSPHWCPGCGYHPVVNGGEHRADCTAGQGRRCHLCPEHLAVTNVTAICLECHLSPGGA